MKDRSTPWCLKEYGCAQYCCLQPSRSTDRARKMSAGKDPTSKKKPPVRQSKQNPLGQEWISRPQAVCAHLTSVASWSKIKRTKWTVYQLLMKDYDPSQNGHRESMGTSRVQVFFVQVFFVQVFLQGTSLFRASEIEQQAKRIVCLQQILLKSSSIQPARVF